MNPPLQTIRLSKQEVDILNGLKRKTRINQWNVLCRMAFCLSCQDPTEPSGTLSEKADGGVELDWETFSGENSEIYAGIALAHKITTKSLFSDSQYFRRLLSRGVMKLKDKVGISKLE